MDSLDREGPRIAVSVVVSRLSCDGRTSKARRGKQGRCAGLRRRQQTLAIKRSTCVTDRFEGAAGYSTRSMTRAAPLAVGSRIALLLIRGSASGPARLKGSRFALGEARPLARAEPERGS